MEDTILVGTPRNIDHEFIDERENLVKILDKECFAAKKADVCWPRDCFVNHNGRILKENEHGAYADGGYVVDFPGFILASVVVSFHFGDSPEERISKLKKIYPDSKIRILNAPYWSTPDIPYTAHIDLVVLPIPQRKLLIVDDIYLRNNKKEIEFLLEETGFQFETVPSCNGQFPCNSLVAEGRDNLIVFGPPGLGVVLPKYDIRYVELDMRKNFIDGGGVRCATNILPANYKGELDFLSDERHKIPSSA
mgnify:FL=1